MASSLASWSCNLKSASLCTMRIPWTNNKSYHATRNSNTQEGNNYCPPHLKFGENAIDSSERITLIKIHYALISERERQGLCGTPPATTYRQVQCSGHPSKRRPTFPPPPHTAFSITGYLKEATISGPIVNAGDSRNHSHNTNTTCIPKEQERRDSTEQAEITLWAPMYTPHSTRANEQMDYTWY